VGVEGLGIYDVDTCIFLLISPYSKSTCNTTEDRRGKETGIRWIQNESYYGGAEGEYRGMKTDL